MFKIFFIAVLSLPLFIPFADDKKAAANVQQEDGIYLFIMSKPVSEFSILGSVKVGGTITSNPLQVLIKKCKKEFPSAEALIISDPDFQKAKADAVIFK